MKSGWLSALYNEYNSCPVPSYTAFVSGSTNDWGGIVKFTETPSILSELRVTSEPSCTLCIATVVCMYSNTILISGDFECRMFTTILSTRWWVSWNSKVMSPLLVEISNEKTPFSSVKVATSVPIIMAASTTGRSSRDDKTLPWIWVCSLSHIWQEQVSITSALRLVVDLEHRNSIDDVWSIS